MQELLGDAARVIRCAGERYVANEHSSQLAERQAVSDFMPLEDYMIAMRRRPEDNVAKDARVKAAVTVQPRRFTEKRRALR